MVTTIIYSIRNLLIEYLKTESWWTKYYMAFLSQMHKNKKPTEF